MKLVISLDVEEEGLFSGRYDRRPTGVSNVAALDRLEFIPREFGFPLTLLPTYQVTESTAAREVLQRWRERHGAEIGAHLHHWNTPPFGSDTGPEPLATAQLPGDLVLAKLQTLVGAIGSHFGRSPQSFRMGRFDWWPFILDLLPQAGLTCDSSMVPLAHYRDRVDQFLTPADPFWLNVGEPPARLLETPVTMEPVTPRLARLVYRLSQALGPAWGEGLRAKFRFLGAVGVAPIWYPLPSMQLAARWHRRRGGRVLHMFLHSSELHPGATPQFPTEAAVRGLTDKIRAFLHWLVRNGPVAGATMAQLTRNEDWALRTEYIE